MTDSNLPDIAMLPELRALYLTGLPVSDANLLVLERLQHLERIDLGGTKQ